MTQPLRKNLPVNAGRIIPAEKVRIMNPPQETVAVGEAPPTIPAEDRASGHDTEVVLLRDGERVKTIVVKCTCGQVISLDCEY